jgi:hypothetical protein
MASNKETIEFLVELSGKINASFKKTMDAVDEITKNINTINSETISPVIDPKSEKQLKELEKSTKGIGGNLFSMKNAALGAGVAIAAGIGIAVSGFVGLTNEMNEARDQMKAFGVTGEDEINGSLASLKALQNQFGDKIDQTEFIKAAKSIQTNFGGSFEDAAERVRELGVATGGQLDLDNITEYANQVDNLADLSAAVVIQTRQGLYQDKALDTIKEAKLGFSDLGKAQKEALGEIGVSAADIEKQINAGGSISDIIAQVFEDKDLSATQVQKLTTSLLAGAGEDLGNAGREALLEGLSKGYDELFEETDPEILKRAEESKKLADEQVKATESFGKVLKTVEGIWGKIQTQIFKVVGALNPLFESFNSFLNDQSAMSDIWEGMQPIFDHISSVWDTITKTAMRLWPIVKKIVDPMIQLGKDILPVVSDVFETIFDVVTTIVEAVDELWEDLFGESVFQSIADLGSALAGVFTGMWDVAKPILGAIVETLGFILQNDALDALGDRLRGVNDGLKAGGVDGAKNAFVEVGPIGPQLPTDKKAPEIKAGGNKVEDQAKGGTGGTKLDNQITKTAGEVKTINITIDKIQEIGVMQIAKGDIAGQKQAMQELLASVAADFSQF